MTEEELSIRTRLSIQRALLGVVTPNIRMVTVGWSGLMEFRMIAYFDNIPTEEQIEDFNAVSAEVIADIPFEKDRVDCIFSNEPYRNLEILKCIVYSRKRDGSVN